MTQIIQLRPVVRACARSLPVMVAVASLGALSLLASCAPAAPVNQTAPPVGATVQAAGTQVNAALGAAATAVQTGVVQPAATAIVDTHLAAATAFAPTAQAAATHVAPTMAAAATQAVSSVGTSVAASPVHVTNVIVDPNDTTVAVQNSGPAVVNLAGWTLLLGPEMSVALGDITLGPGVTRTLHFSQGIDTASDVFLGFGSTAADAGLSPGAHVVLIAPQDKIASVYSVT